MVLWTWNWWVLDTEAALEQVTDVDDTHPMKSNVDDTQPRESDFEDTHTGESVVGDTHLWDSDVDYLHFWDWSDVDDTHPGEMLTSPTRGNLMLTPTPGKLMLTSPTRGRESDVEDAQSQKSSVQGTFPYTVSNPVNCAELSEWTFCQYSAKNLWYIGKKPELKSKGEHAVRQRLYFEA